MTTNVDDILKKYLNRFPNEREKLNQFSAFLENNKKEQIFNRIVLQVDMFLLWKKEKYYY